MLSVTGKRAWYCRRNPATSVCNTGGQFEQSLGLARQAGDRRLQAGVLKLLGLFAYEDGDLPAARLRLEQSLDLMRELGDPSGISLALSNLGELERRAGNLATAWPLLEEALALAHELGEQSTAANALYNLGHLAIAQGDPVGAEAALQESLVLWPGSARVGIAETLVGLAVAALAKEAGGAARAARLLGAVAAEQARGTHFSPTDQDLYDRLLATARSALDPSVWEAAYAAGQATSLDQAVAYALDGEA